MEKAEGPSSQDKIQEETVVAEPGKIEKVEFRSAKD